jgi:single-strand DNA-binding protein
VDGRLQQRRWETEDGQKRSKHEIVAQTVTFLPKRQDGGGGDPGGPGGMDEPGFEEEPQG